MGFSNFIFLWTLIFPIIVLLYYFFRKKYQNQPVSSTLFWSEIMQETKVSPYLKHLQKNLLLYLQLLTLILLVLSLMNPFVKTSKMAGEQAVLIVDTSATMLAGKENSTFDDHKKQMLSLVSSIGGRPVTIITTGDEPQIIVRQETNQNIVEKAINELTVTYEEEQLPKAIDVAHAFIGDTPTSIYLYTDSVERGELPMESDHVKWIVRGAESDLENVAITRFAATGTEENAQALIQIHNQTSEEQQVELSITNESGEVVFEELLNVSAEDEITKTIEEIKASKFLTAQIQVEDNYKVDNSFVTVLGLNNSSIVVDQQMHQLIQKGFQVLNHEVKIVPSDQLMNLSRNAIIVTRQTELLGTANSPIVLFGRNDQSPEEVNSLVDVSEDPLFAFSPLEDVYVSSVYPAFENYETIATIGGKPFIQRSPRGDIVVLSDIQATDWPLHPSFPLFLWSIQNELVEGTTSLGTFSPNEHRTVSLTPGDWSIYSANNEFVSAFDKLSDFRAPIEPGVYKVRSNNEEKQMVVQLSGQERILKEGKSFELGMVQNNGQEETSQRNLLIWLLIPILLLLLIEWEVQRRRGFTN
ncbi:BatA and WFA domain-containing protein [Ureibacillus composti]|nr:BatA and WFA domain-containing protein [Ureibacillus composti]